MAIFDDTGLGVSNDDVSDETNINDIIARLVTSFNVTVENRLATVETGQSLSQQWAVADVGTLIIDNTTGVTIQGYSALAWGTEAKQWASNAQGTLVVLADGTASAEYSAKAQALAAKNWVSGTPGVSTEADGSTTIPYTAHSKALEALNSAAAALVSEGNAATSEGNSATSEANALSYSGLAEGYKDDALSYKDLAQEWAENPEDVEITGYPGQFSALHWAAKAAAIGIESVTSTSPITVDNTDPLNPIVGLDDSLYMTKTGDTGSAELPTGTTLERDAVPAEGYLRFNTDNSEAEIYDGSDWTSVGGGGGLDWSTAAQSTDFTAEDAKGYPVDTSGGVVEVQLPVGTAGMTVAIKDYAQTFDDFHCLLVPNGTEKIEGVNDNLKVDTRGAYVTLVYTDATKGWLAVSASAQNPVINKPRAEFIDSRADVDSVIGWNDRALTAGSVNEIPGASVSGGSITLQAGTYNFKATSYGILLNRHYLGIRDDSDNELLLGPTLFTSEATTAVQNSIDGVVVLTKPTVVKLSVYCDSAKESGLAPSTSYGTYSAKLIIHKLDSDIKTYTVSNPEMYLSKPLMHILDSRTSGTGPDTLADGVFNTRALNTLKVNEIAGASLSSNTVTLPAGTYWVEGVFPLSLINCNVAGTQTAKVNIAVNGTDVIYGVNHGFQVYGQSPHQTNHLVKGRLVLTEASAITVRHWVNVTGGIIQGGRTPVVKGEEIYGELLIWQEDAVTQAPVVHQPVNQPVVGAEVTGGIFGGELVYSGTTDVNVNPISCMDDTLTQEIVVTGTTNVVLSAPTINTIYNFFAVRYNTDTYGIEYDTDVNGANLGASVTHKRWIGFVLTDSSGDVIEFYQNGDFVALEGFSVGTSSGTTEVTFSLSAVIPVNRVKAVGFSLGTGASNQRGVYLRTSTFEPYVLLNFIQGTYSPGAAAGNSLLPNTGSVYVQRGFSDNSPEILLSKLKLKR